MKSLIISLLIMYALGLGAIQLIKSDNTPEITERKYPPRPGYETPTTDYDITVSPAWRWEHGGHSTGLVILGFVLLAAASVYIWYLDVQFKKVNWILLIILVLGGYTCIVGKYADSYYQRETYSKRFTQQQYESSKDNVEKLFE